MENFVCSYRTLNFFVGAARARNISLRNCAGSAPAGAGLRKYGSSARVSSCGGRVCFPTSLDVCKLCWQVEPRVYPVQRQFCGKVKVKYRTLKSIPPAQCCHRGVTTSRYSNHVVLTLLHSPDTRPCWETLLLRSRCVLTKSSCPYVLRTLAQQTPASDPQRLVVNEGTNQNQIKSSHQILDQLNEIKRSQIKSLE